jgi:hypothetical protein
MESASRAAMLVTRTRFLFGPSRALNSFFPSQSKPIILIATRRRFRECRSSMKDWALRIFQKRIGVNVRVQTIFIMLCVFLALISLGIGVRNWAIHWSLGESENVTELASFGSYLQGAVASPFTLASVLLLFAAFIYQENALYLQRTQFEKQNFEATFFRFLDLQNEIASNMKISLRVTRVRGEETLQGRQCFTSWFNELRSRMVALRRPHIKAAAQGIELTHADLNVRQLVNMADAIYRNFYRENAVLGHYFRNFSHLIKLIATSGVQNKEWYADLASAQLSEDELALLFYHGLSSYGRDIHPLINGLELLNNLDITKVEQDLRDAYLIPLLPLTV